MQIQTKNDRQFLPLVETHFLMKHQGIFDTSNDASNGAWYRKAFDVVGKLAACGPFALTGPDSDYRVGCGPLFVASISTDGAKVDKFGIGWALGLGPRTGSGAKSDFGMGIGLLLDTGNQIIDSNIVDPVTLQIRDPYKADVLAGKTSVLINRATTSAFIMISKTF